MKNLFTLALVLALSGVNFAAIDNVQHNSSSTKSFTVDNTSNGILGFFFGNNNKNRHPNQRNPRRPNYGNSCNNNNYGSNYGHNSNYGYGTNYGYGHNTNNYGANSFNNFLNVLRNESFDSKRLNMAKDYVSRGGASAHEIAQMSKHFSFDSHRLEFAKFAYKYCYDKRNYYLLRDTFSFSSNYNNLLDYTRNY